MNKVDDILSRMTLEQKTGGLFVVDFLGTVAHRQTFEMIHKLQVAGFRIDTSIRIKKAYADEASAGSGNLVNGDRKPAGICRDLAGDIHPPFCTPEEYCRELNRLRRSALERDLGVPLHFTLDQEGNGNENYTIGNPRLFPSQMGMAAAGVPFLVYRASKVLAKQLRSAGLNWIHSPVLDVNTYPENYEIAARSFSENSDEVILYAREMLKAFKEEGLIATGKHFPGRGHSDADSHYSLPVIELDKKTLYDTHIAPFKAMIDAGIPAIMIAHTAYPALDASLIPATLSKKIITGILKEELGFTGTVTTDNLLMGGVVKQYGVPEACVRAVEAGVDLLLLRSQSGLCEEAWNAVYQAVKEGRISEERLNDANRRVLKVKMEYGLFENGGIVDKTITAASQITEEAYVVERKIAQKAVTVKDDIQILPLSQDDRVLLVEGIHPTHLVINNQECHPSIFSEIMVDFCPELSAIETADFDDFCFDRVKERVHEADYIIVTNWVERRGSTDNASFIRRLQSFGLPVIVVTNSPFKVGAPSDLPTIINVYSANPESLRAACAAVFTPPNPGTQTDVNDLGNIGDRRKEIQV